MVITNNPHPEYGWVATWVKGIKVYQAIGATKEDASYNLAQDIRQDLAISLDSELLIQA